MDANDYPSSSLKNPVSSVNSALNNSRWKFFKSRSGDILARTYASDALLHSAGFIEISEAEYRRLEQEQQS